MQIDGYDQNSNFIALTAPSGFFLPNVGLFEGQFIAFAQSNPCAEAGGYLYCWVNVSFTGGIPPGSQGVFSLKWMGDPMPYWNGGGQGNGVSLSDTNAPFCDGGYPFLPNPYPVCQFASVEGQLPGPIDCSVTSCPTGEAIGTIASTTGTVTLTNASGGSTAAVPGQSVTLGDTLTTGADASAVISSPDGSQLTLYPTSVMDYYGKVSATRFVKILLGRVWAQITPNSDRCSNDSEISEPCDAIDFGTPNAVAGVRGTDLIVETDGTATTVTVNEGVVNVTDLTGDILNSVTAVSAGSSLTIAPHPVPTPAVTATPSPLNFGGVSVGASSTQTISLSINTALTISNIVAGGDYSVGTNSCMAAYSAATTCTVPITFTPTKPGQAWVPLVVTDSNNNNYSFGVGGTGLASAVAFTPGIINTVAGNGTACPNSTTPCGDNGPATGGELSTPSGLAMDGAGNIYIADSGNNRIRVVNMQTSPITVAGVTIGAGNIATVAGTGAQGNTNTGNGGVKATTAELNSPGAVALDGPGNIYVADTDNSLVRKVDVNGMMTTFAGGGSVCANATDNVGDGCPATGAQLATPTGLAVDTLGYVYIADSGNARVRKVDLNGMITTFAGNGTPGYNGDSGAATSAELQNPAGLAFDSVGNLYIADSSNNVIRQVNTSGAIATFAGNGSAGYSGDGKAATQAQLNQPRGVAADSAGNLYIADTNNDFLRKVDAGGVITTVAGNGSSGVSCPFGTDIVGDGCPATSAFVQPWSVAVNGTGNLYVPDYGNNRIRKVNVTTSLLSFGTLNVGATSNPQGVEASNVGNTPLDFAATNAFVASANFQLQNGANECAAGGSLAPGADCTLDVVFSPTAVGNPVTGTLTVNDDAPNQSQTVQLTGIALQSSSPIISWATPAPITYGTPLSSAQLNATASVPGTFVYTPGAGTILGVGSQTLSVTFTPTDTTDYTTATATVQLTVNQATPAALTTPTPGSTFAGPSVTFTWTLGYGPTAYQLWLGTTGVGSHNLYESGATKATTVTVSGLPTYGVTVYARLWSEISGAWQSADYTYTEAGTPVAPVLTAPAPGSVLSGSSVAFTWTAGAGPAAYQLWLGTTGVGSQNLYDSGATTATTETVSGLPANGEPVYARLWWEIDATWQSADYIYFEAGTPVPPALITPVPGRILSGSTVAFAWTPSAGVTDYQLWLGSTRVGAQNLYDSGATKATTVTVSGLPTNGVTLYARLWWEVCGVWTSADYTYTEAGTPVLPVLTTPTPGSTLSGSSVAFTWTAGTGPVAYQLYLGTTGVGSHNLYESGSTTATTVTVNNLPTYGVTVYARLWWEIDAAWKSADYTYTESGAPVLPVLTTPAPGSVLSGSSVAFTWTAGGGPSSYQLYLGTTGVGSHNLYESGATTATTVTVNNLPTNGVTVYARFWWEIGGAWNSADYTYTEAGTPVLPVLTTPAPGSVLSGSSVAFTWTAGAGPVAYQLYLGTAGVGSHNLYASGATTATTETVSDLPTTGVTVYARFWWKIDEVWQSADYTYTAQ